MTKKSVLIGAVCLIALVAVVGCFMQPDAAIKGNVRLVLSDKMMAKSIMPPVSLEADHYSVHGEGVSGTALGSTFDVDITAAAGSMDLNLLPGDWTFAAVVWNDDTPSVAVGEGSAADTVVVGVPMTITIDCLPYTGDGTLVIDLDWVPDIIAAPSVEAEIKDFGGTTTPVPMTLASSTAADGTLDIEQGWYIGAVRIFDNDALNAGIVRTVRLMAGVTTTWTEYLTVSQLEGEITLDLGYFPGLPLNLTTNIPEGDYTVYDAMVTTFSVDSVDNDGGTTVAYSWYLNGELTELSTTNSYDLDAADFMIGSNNYLSAVVWQSDGERAGDAQWKIIKEEFPLSAYSIEVNAFNNTPNGGTMRFELFDSGMVSLDLVTAGSTEHEVVTHTFTDLDAGSYYVAAYLGGSALPYFYDQTTVPGEADLIVIPVLPEASVTISVND